MSVLPAMQDLFLIPATINVPSVLLAPLRIPLIKVAATIAQKDGTRNLLPLTMVVKNAIVVNMVIQQKLRMLLSVVKIAPLVVFLNSKALMDHW